MASERAYPDVQLQNGFEQYRFIDFPGPSTDRHPTTSQILITSIKRFSTTV